MVAVKLYIEKLRTLECNFIQSLMPGGVIDHRVILVGCTTQGQVNKFSFTGRMLTTSLFQGLNPGLQTPHSIATAIA